MDALTALYAAILILWYWMMKYISLALVLLVIAKIATRRVESGKKDKR